MDFVYASDDNFARVAGVSLVSLLEYNKNVVIHFLDAGLTQDSKDNIIRLVNKFDSSSTIIFYDVNDLLSPISKSMPALENSFATYARLFIEILLPKNIEKCFYIDCDTVIKGSLESVFLDKEVNTLYMAYDLVTPVHKEEILLSSNDTYYNAGICFINLKRWRLLDYTNKLMELLKTSPSFRFHDQDIMNIVFKGDIGLLDFRYNIMSQNIYFGYAKYCKEIYHLNEDKYYTEFEYQESLKNAIIYHFTSVPFMARPWCLKSKHPKRKFFYRIRDKDAWLAGVMINGKFSKTQKLIQLFVSIVPTCISAYVICLLYKRFYRKTGL